jgi:hypothetical protein
MRRYRASVLASERPSKGIQVSELLYFGFALRYRPPQTGAGILRAETIRLVSGLIDSAPQAASETLCVLAATKSDKSVGYAAGEVRSWQVRAPACGWLYAIGGEERCRLRRYASSLTAELISRFKQSGVGTIRTVMDVDDYLLMSFLRSCGMTTGSFVELEMTLPANE